MTTSTYRRAFDLDEAATLLSSMPDVVDALVGHLPPGWDDAREAEGTWSPFDVIGHLIHGERADWIPRLRIILEHGEAKPFDPFDREAQRTESVGKSMQDLLAEFRALRSANVATLRGIDLTAADLERRGVHPAFGPVTLRQLLATWVAHDMDHVMQITRVLARQYTDEVGPWSAYMRVISGRQG